MIQLETYTPQRMDNFLISIQEIHKALVCHKDPKPRNMIVKDDPERVVWLDFDRAQTYHEESMTDEQKRYLEREETIVADFRRNLVCILQTHTQTIHGCLIVC